jgi:hypothetical protein
LQDELNKDHAIHVFLPGVELEVDRVIRVEFERAVGDVEIAELRNQPLVLPTQAHGLAEFHAAAVNPPLTRPNQKVRPLQLASWQIHLQRLVDHAVGRRAGPHRMVGVGSLPASHRKKVRQIVHHPTETTSGAEMSGQTA